MISVFSGDEGSPVYAETPRGKVIIAVLSAMKYTCKGPPTEKFDKGEMLFSLTSSVVPWIYSLVDAANYEQHPYFVSIMKAPEAAAAADPEGDVPTYYYHHCNGAFIARDFLLSAAHCFYNETTMEKLDFTVMKIQYGRSEVAFTRGDSQQFGRGFHVDIDDVFTFWDERDPKENRTVSSFFERSGDYALVRFKPPKVLNYKYLLLPEPQDTDVYVTEGKTAYIVASGRTSPKRQYNPGDQEYRMKSSGLNFRPDVLNCSAYRSPYEANYLLCARRAWTEHRTCERKCSL